MSRLKSTLLGIAAALAIGIAAQAAQGATVCNFCGYVPGSSATYLGVHNAGSADASTFQHVFDPQFRNQPFTDYWVFDISPGALGSASANFTFFSAIQAFAGALYADGGSTCPGGAGTACSSLGALGALIGSGTGNNWEIQFNIAPGRYVLVVSGVQRDNSVYTGQIGFSAGIVVPEPGVLALLAMGLFAAAFGARRRAA